MKSYRYCTHIMNTYDLQRPSFLGMSNHMHACIYNVIIQLCIYVCMCVWMHECKNVWIHVANMNVLMWWTAMEWNAMQYTVKCVVGYALYVNRYTQYRLAPRMEVPNEIWCGSTDTMHENTKGRKLASGSLGPLNHTVSIVILRQWCSPMNHRGHAWHPMWAMIFFVPG